jgi:hypothetical protein
MAERLQVIASIEEREAIQRILRAPAEAGRGGVGGGGQRRPPAALTRGKHRCGVSHQASDPLSSLSRRDEPLELLEPI